MNKILTFGLSGLISIGILGCSSAPKLPNTWTLNTTSKSQSYNYCESCPIPTKLTKGNYKPLEPDEPIIIAQPIAKSITITTNKKRRVHRPVKHKQTHKQKIIKSNPKQCIQWSN